MCMKRAGAGVPSANRITLLRDADGDGVAETAATFLERLNSPFGMALVGDDFYVANTDAIVRFPYRAGDTQITAPRRQARRSARRADQPPLDQEHHRQPRRHALYATVGSNSNVGENGIEDEEGRAAILEVDLATGQRRALRLRACAIRTAWRGSRRPARCGPSVNERDELGSDLVPDYMTSVQDGAFYGWPYSYYGQHVDARVEPQRPDLVAQAIAPDYALGAHTASLGLAFYSGELLAGSTMQAARSSASTAPGTASRAAATRSSSCRSPTAGRPGLPRGRPDRLRRRATARRRAARSASRSTEHGALLVADDVGNAIWRVQAAATGN